MSTEPYTLPTPPEPGNFTYAKWWGTELRGRRERRGWSKSELARRASLSAPTVGIIESDRLIPYPVQVAKLNAALAGEP